MLVDHDVLLPHNLARHDLDGAWLGFPKSEAMAARVNTLTDREPSATALIVNILRPGTQHEALTRALQDAEAIVDWAASVPVARALAALPNVAARRVSLFLNPAGSALVLLAEDAARSVTLDQLEVQYYQWLAEEEGGELSNHLDPADGTVRYGATCRDVSVVLAQDDVALWAAVGSRALKAALGQPQARIRVWSVDRDSGVVSHRERIPLPMMVRTFGGWTLVLNPSVVRQMRELRLKALPRETGGTLVGSYDLERRTAYVTGLLPSPPDSVEQPTLYIRGAQELSEAHAEVSRCTAGMLEYVGEWHSHPDGYGVQPSSDDAKVFAWLRAHLQEEGLPPLMAIAGESTVAWHLEHLEEDVWTV